MRYNRKEPFRYTFNKPVDARFKITGIDEKLVSTSKGKAEIINLSPHGIRLKSELDIPHPEEKTIQLSIKFELNQQSINLFGEVVWKKGIGKTKEYGIDIVISDSARQSLIDQLKVYAKQASLK